MPSGIIHADLFPDNVLLMNDQVSGVIDFYFACNDALAYDLAVMLNAWCFENDGAYNLTKGKALIGGVHAPPRIDDRPNAMRCRPWRAVQRCGFC